MRACAAVDSVQCSARWRKKGKVDLGWGGCHQLGVPGSSCTMLTPFSCHPHSLEDTPQWDCAAFQRRHALQAASIEMRQEGRDARLRLEVHCRPAVRQGDPSGCHLLHFPAIPPTPTSSPTLQRGGGNDASRHHATAANDTCWFQTLAGGGGDWVSGCRYLRWLPCRPQRLSDLPSDP